MASEPGPAPGELHLGTLLSSMNPVLHPSTFCFITFPSEDAVPATLAKQMSFLEPEGVTVITTQSSAEEHGIAKSPMCALTSRMITLMVHSSLDAIGFMAAISAELGRNGIPSNVVAAFYHDHIFVPVGKEDDALSCLKKLRDAASTETAQMHGTPRES